MTKHVHAEMIKSKADNADLILFIYSDNHKTWFECNEPQKLFIYPSVKFFLCLPQHKEACLHWLNGGQIECKDIDSDNWFSLDCAEHWKWSSLNNTMSEKYEIRVKPRKEKRWIIVDPKNDYTFNFLFYSWEDAEKENGGQHQVIEIEVEI